MKINPRNHLEEFTSINGLLMVKGINFNWQKTHTNRDNTGPYYLQVSDCGWGGILCNYNYYTDKMLKIGRGPNEGIKFYALNIQKAEEIFLACLKGNNSKLAPLYEN